MLQDLFPVNYSTFEVFMKKVARKRHIAKTLSWRIVGTIDTILISSLITGQIEIGLAIGGIEVFSKMLLYYFHERIWYNAQFWDGKTRARHLLKTITWRVIGTLDTMLLSYLISGDPIFGISIGGIEFISKMILYYLHEEAWYRSSYGIEKNDA